MAENYIVGMRDYLKSKMGKAALGGIAAIVFLSSAPSLKAQEDYLNKRIKDKIPQGSYSVQGYIPAGGDGRAFLYLVDKIDENKGTFYLPKDSITELGNKSLEEIVETVKNSSKLLRETDYGKINVVPVKLKGEVVGYLIHTD